MKQILKVSVYSKIPSVTGKKSIIEKPEESLTHTSFTGDADAISCRQLGEIHDSSRSDYVRKTLFCYETDPTATEFFFFTEESEAPRASYEDMKETTVHSHSQAQVHSWVSRLFSLDPNHTFAVIVFVR